MENNQMDPAVRNVFIALQTLAVIGLTANQKYFPPTVIDAFHKHYPPLLNSLIAFLVEKKQRGETPPGLDSIIDGLKEKGELFPFDVNLDRDISNN